VHKLKILQVCPRYYPDIGGVEEHVRNISERLSKKYDVSVFTTDPSGKLPKQEIINGVKIKRFKSWAPNEAYYFSKELKEYLMKNSDSFDVVHAHSYHAFPALYAAYAKKNNRLVFTLHYFGKGSTTFRAFLHVPYKLLARKLFQKADAVISTSNYEKNLVHNDFGINLAEITTIPHGLTLKDFTVLSKSQNHCRTILYVGRLVKFKGVDYAIKALPYLDQDIRLEIIGSGPHYPNLLKLASRLGVKDRVLFLGGSLSRQEILQKYADADLFVILSKHECFGICVAEALASGTACIVANTSALTEWIDNKNCFGVNYPISVEALVASINRTIGKHAERAKLFDWDDVVDKIINVYRGDNL
jgi:glycosyltransferase involved in cell wall biosynthesis